MKKIKEKQGISLVALIITIIVLIILTGAVIMNITGENSTIDKAKEAVFKNDITSYEDSLARYEMNKKIEIETGKVVAEQTNATTAAEIQEIIPEFKKEYEGIVKITDGKLMRNPNVENENFTNWLNDLNVQEKKIKFYIASNSTLQNNTEFEVTEGTTLAQFVNNQEDLWICSSNIIHKSSIMVLYYIDNGYRVPDDNNKGIENGDQYFWNREPCPCGGIK